jgi:hypothetical protein
MGVIAKTFAPFPVFGFLDEITEKLRSSAIHDLEFFSDERSLFCDSSLPFRTLLAPSKLVFRSPQPSKTDISFANSTGHMMCYSHRANYLLTPNCVCGNIAGPAEVNEPGRSLKFGMLPIHRHFGLVFHRRFKKCFKWRFIWPSKKGK